MEYWGGEGIRKVPHVLQMARLDVAVGASIDQNGKSKDETKPKIFNQMMGHDCEVGGIL